ncbi:Lrp/AsnC family transcriptional regulator, partial [Burkholderia gladioli]|nr:Lrp/AsnC family transcriptional regulator [Burkholderia gladioli]
MKGQFKLDAIDRRILQALQRDGRMQNIRLADEVGLSPSPCLRRVRLLEEAGVIEKYVAVVDASKVGKALSVFVRVWLKAQDSDTVDRFADELARYFIVTPADNSRRLQDLRAAAEVRLQMLYGDDPVRWQILADWQAAEPFLACAVSRAW